MGKPLLQKRLLSTALLAFGIALCANDAAAIDFKVSGEWLVGFGAGTGELYSHYREPGHGQKRKTDSNDMFEANQRLRIQLDAVASEALSGTVGFEIGDTRWGMAEQGGALGADSKDIIKLKNAYIDWVVPSSDIRFRMGIQGMALPNTAGGSAILDADVAGIAANYKINDNIGITALWARPVNDNFNDRYFNRHGDRANYLDNMDLFALSLPITLDGYEITPWVMYGMLGKNSMRGLMPVNEEEPWETSDGILGLTIPGLNPGMNFSNGNPLDSSSTGKAYGSMFWAGLPDRKSVV